MCLVGFIAYKTDTHEKWQRRTTVQLNVSIYGERIKNEITNGFAITDALKQILISENGKISQFDMIAENLISDSIESVQLAPDGVVTDIYPAEGNEAGKIDLLHDKDRGRISCYARDNHTIITQGPFELKQGSYGIAVRNPVYLNDEHGQAYFWGFTIVILRVPDIFSDSIHALSGFGYEYRLSKTETPWSDTYKTVYQSDGQITQPVSYDFTIGKESWKFEVTPKSGWHDNLLIAEVSLIFTVITFLLSGLTRVWLVSRDNENKFQILARTDSLTGIYNRYGFDESAEKMMNKNPKAHFVFVLFDIDDFKFINDIYGHAYGDLALKSLADSMKAFFPADALLGKNGCMAYSEGLQSGVRKQLGFAFKDISEHLPGAFIIYRADKDNDELFRLTNKRFRNLILKDEQKQIESSIWEQIDSGNENDYIHFHLRKADGSYLSVLDHGRIVENQQYGRVFYVLFMGWEDMHIHYSDKFSG